jgi:hypothetical protein
MLHIKVKKSLAFFASVGFVRLLPIYIWFFVLKLIGKVPYLS